MTRTEEINLLGNRLSSLLEQAAHDRERGIKGDHEDAIETIGDRLFELGGTVLMRGKLDLAVDRASQADAEIMETIADQAWNGIGDEHDGWLA